MAEGLPTVSGEALASLLNLTARRVQQLAKEGIVKRAGRGKYNLVESVQGYVRFLQEQAERRSDPDSLDLVTERTRLAREQADAAAMANAESRGELIPVEYVEEVLAHAATAAGSQFDAVPIRIKQRIPALSPRDVEIITEEVARARNELASLGPPDHRSAPRKGGGGSRKRTRTASRR